VGSKTIDLFSELKDKVQLAKKKGSNLLLYTFAGSGCTHYLKELARLDKDLAYINYPGVKLGKYNLLDLPFGEAVIYTRQVDIRQKYLLVVNSGFEFHSSAVKELTDHLYFTFPLRAGSPADIKDMIARFRSKSDINTLGLIMKLSGGIPKLAKYLIVNEGKVDENDLAFKTLIKGISDSISGYSPSELKQLSLVDDKGNFTSELLAKHLAKTLDIKINFDLSFEENGILTKEKLTALEAKIIKKILDNSGQISKEEVSDIKWGIGKYDQFSDQAINKQMRRLSQKLSRFTIVTIPKVGFEIQ
jgi:hypothetical protein